jgi:RNA polymerase sigma-70 factor, ECF subfamily
VKDEAALPRFASGKAMRTAATAACMSQKAALRQRIGMRTDHVRKQASSDLALQSFEELLEASARQLGQFLVSVIKDRALAEDVLQETLLIAVERQAELVSIENPRAWLFGVARNRALQALRRRRRAFMAIERLIRPGDDSPDPAEAVAVRDVLARVLSPDDRMLIVLRYVHGFSSSDLAAMTGRSADGIRQRLSRARKRLLASLDDHGRSSKRSIPGGEFSG